MRARLSPDGYLGLHLTIGMTVLLLAVFVFAHIAEDVVERDSLVVLLDAHLMHWVQAHATAARTAFFLFVTHWHNTLGVFVMTTLLVLWLAHLRSWAWLLRVLLSVPLGMLHGVPLSVKDLIAVGGVRQTFGSRTLANNMAAGDAPSVERAAAASTCIIGKTTQKNLAATAVLDAFGKLGCPAPMSTIAIR